MPMSGPPKDLDPSSHLPSAPVGEGVTQWPYTIEERSIACQGVGLTIQCRMHLINLINKFISGGSRSAHPLILDNNQRFAKGLQYPGPMANYSFVVFDTELTGLSRKHDEIVAIGAVRVKGMQIVCGETFYALVRPEGRAQTQSTLVHRLTPQELLRAASMDEILPRFLEFCGEAFLVGHFVRLDLEFVNRATRRYLGGMVTTPYLDTMGLAMAYNDQRNGVSSDPSNRAGSYSLAALSKEFSLPLFREHNALEDAMQTAFLFLYLVKKLQSYGKQTLDDYLDAGRCRNRQWWQL